MNGEDCYLLGAGFSRAISDSMPTLANLQEDVLGALGFGPEVLEPFGSDLEQWMSYLSVDQPWLTYAANLRNRALFNDAAHAVAESISGAEARALKDPLPLWLKRLVGGWFDTESTLISFNYDTLIERAASQQRLLSDWGDIYRVPLNIRPIINHGLMMGAGRYSETIPELFKLHGSTNWAFSGLDSPPTDPINIVKSGGLWQVEEQPQAMRRGEGAARHADLEPLIIPPTGTKGTFYSNRALQAQWRDAFSRLSGACQLTIIGYSFPASDLGARHFVANALPPDLPITIVDYSNETAQRIMAFLGESHAYEVHTGATAVKNFVELRTGDLVEWGFRSANGLLLPHLRVNHKPHPTAEKAWLGKTFASREEGSPIVDTMLEQLYPGLSSKGLSSWSNGDDLLDSKFAITQVSKRWPH